MFRTVLSLTLVAALAPAQALAWGASGHRMIGEVAIRGLPQDLPAFLRTPRAVLEVGELSREPDRSKGSGRVHDTNRDPGHYINLSEDGTVLGGVKISALPPTRGAYETALRIVETDSWKHGYLPYSIEDQAQQLTKDFAMWRVAAFEETHEKTKARRTWYRADRERREALIFTTLGQLSHFVGDAAQPLHVSIHYNGWGPYPNPNGYTSSHIHGPFEGDFVAANIKAADVLAILPAPAPCGCAPEDRAAGYIALTLAQVEPLYQLEKDGGFKGADPRGVAFASARLATGAGELRDIIVDAWAASIGAKANVGYPQVKVSEVLAGAADPYESLYGKD